MKTSHTQLEQVTAELAAQKLEAEKTAASLQRYSAILHAISQGAEALLRSANLNDGLHYFLAQLGVVTTVSRVYIFQAQLYTDNSYRYFQRYEWVSTNITPQIDNPDLQEVTAEQAGFVRWEHELSQGNLIYGDIDTFPISEQPLLEAQQILSLIVVPIFVGDTWWGFIGFDDCISKHQWTEAERDALQAASNIISAALQRKQAEDALRKSEAQYRGLFLSTQRYNQESLLLNRVRSALARELDLSTVFRIVCEAVASTFGYTQVSIYLLDENMLRLQHQVGYDTVITEININQGVMGRVIRTGKTIWLPDVTTDPDFLEAIEGIVSEICVPLFDNREIVGTFNIESANNVKLTESDVELMVALSEHISAAILRARLHTEIRGREIHNRALINAIPDMIIRCNRDGKYLEVKPALTFPPLAPPEELIGRYLHDVLPPDLVNEAYYYIEKVLKTKQISIYTYQLTTNDIVQHFEAHMVPYDIDEVLVIVRDITERVMAVEALYESELKNRLMLDAVNYPILALTDDLTILHCNNAYADFVSRPQNELEGQNLLTVFPNFRQQLAYQLYRQVLETGETKILESSVRNKDFYLRIDRTSWGLLAIVHDITERKQAQKKALELAMERQRIQVLTEFIQTASHEFRTPLSTIKTTLYLLENINDSETQVDLIQKINHQADSILDLVEALVLMARLDGAASFKFARHDISQLLNHLKLHTQQFSQQKNISMSINIPKNLPLLLVDAEKLYQAMIRIADNAIRYTPKNGIVRIEAYQQEDKVIVAFSDTGIGIESENLEKIFDRFFRCDAVHSTRGFGLGLTIAQKIINTHSGTINVDSEVGHGSTFQIILPLPSNQHEEMDTLSET